VIAATTRAAQAHKESAALPYDQRASILRGARDLWKERAAEIQEWVVRESGSVPAKAALETSTAAQECYEAAAPAPQPAGELLRSAQPRISLARRVPAEVVGMISPFNSPSSCRSVPSPPRWH
jgi:benzaldehyde dehydrogenase (NAD)